MSVEIHNTSFERPSDRVIIALDGMQWDGVSECMNEVNPFVGMGKANSLADRKGWDYTVGRLGRMGVNTMADPKYHDTPKSMQNHLYETAQSLPTIITVHAGGNNLASLQYAVKGRDKARKEMLIGIEDQEEIDKINSIGQIFGITVLTSIDPDECRTIFGGNPRAKVLQFARMANEAGIDGIVCSGQELTAIREVQELDKLKLIVPGITTNWATKSAGQSRTMSPSEAIGRGADRLVIGTAITAPPNGMSKTEAAERIAVELKEAL